MTVSFALFCIIVGIAAANADSDGMNTTQCHACLEDDFGLCNNVADIQNCTNPTTDSCFSAAGRYNNGSTVLYGVARGCISCPNVTEGCKIFTIYFNTVQAPSMLLDCNIMCCRGDQCNNQTVSFLPTTTPNVSATPTGSTTKPASDEPTTSYASYYTPITAVLTIVTIIGAFFF